MTFTFTEVWFLHDGPRVGFLSLPTGKRNSSAEEHVNISQRVLAFVSGAETSQISRNKLHYRRNYTRRTAYQAMLCLPIWVAKYENIWRHPGTPLYNTGCVLWCWTSSSSGCASGQSFGTEQIFCFNSLIVWLIYWCCISIGLLVSFLFRHSLNLSRTKRTSRGTRSSSRGAGRERLTTMLVRGWLFRTRTSITLPSIAWLSVSLTRTSSARYGWGQLDLHVTSLCKISPNHLNEWMNECKLPLTLYICMYARKPCHGHSSGAVICCFQQWLLLPSTYISTSNT